MAVFRPDLYDAALGQRAKPAGASEPIGAFAGPGLRCRTTSGGHLAAFKIGRWKA